MSQTSLVFPKKKTKGIVLLGCSRAEKWLLLHDMAHCRWTRAAMAPAEADALAPEWQVPAGVRSVSSGDKQMWRIDLVQHTSHVIPLQQNMSAASLSLLTHSPMARDAKANFVSFVLFRACCEEPPGCLLSARIYGPSLPDLLHLHYHEHCYGLSLVTPWVRGPMIGLVDANRFKTRWSLLTLCTYEVIKGIGRAVHIDIK